MGATETEQAPQAGAKPLAEHLWLRKLVGEWKIESGEASAAGMPEGPMKGTETVRQFGDFWIVTESKGEVGDQTYANRMTLGYDTHRRRFAGTFVDSSMSFLWVYDGWLEGDVLTLESEGPTFDDTGGTDQYRDIIQFLSDDHRVLRSDVLGKDGEWREFMIMHYHRKR